MRLPTLGTVSFLVVGAAALVLFATGRPPHDAEPDPAPAPAASSAAPAAVPVAIAVPADRGQALVEGMGCAGCHSPPDGPAWSGMTSGGWLAPNITPDPVSGIGAWSEAEVAQYLRTGHVNGRGQAAGPMAGVVEGLRGTPDADIHAAAAWLRRQVPVRDPRDQVAATARGAPASTEDALRGAPSSAIALAGFRPGRPRDGAELFNGVCASCHGRDGAGSSDGSYPSLYRNSTVGRRDPTNLVAVLLWGVQRSTAAGDVFMPGFGSATAVTAPLGDEEIAALANHVLARFGDPGAATLAAADVAAARGAP